MIKKIKICSLVFALCLFSLSVFSQDGRKSYVILFFEDQFKITLHGVKHFYWITPLDSLKSYETKFHHLFTTEYADNVLGDCCSGKDTEPHVVFKNSTYTYDSAYSSQLDILRDLIEKNKKKIQTVTKSWQNGQKETTKISAVVIAGNFCNCNYGAISRERSGYTGQVYFPKSTFSIVAEFWNSEKAKLILNRDFSTIKFDIIWE